MSELVPRVQRRLLRVSEAAEYLSATHSCVRRLIWGGHLPCVMLGRFVRIDRGDLDAFIQAHRSVLGPPGGPGSEILKQQRAGAQPRNPVGEV